MVSDVSFDVVDYVVMGILLVISMAIGIYYGIYKKQQTTEEYLYGNRQMNLFAVALSLLVTYQSAASCLGAPADVYVYNFMIMFGIPGGMLATSVAAFMIVPLLYPLKLNSAYEYLGRRFNSRAVQLLGTAIGMLQTLLYTSVVLFSPALALEAVAGIPLWMSIVVIGIIGTIYTSVGGFKSVIWTDVFQFIILYGGLILIFIIGGRKIGSLEKIIELSKKGGRLDFNASFDPRTRHSLWSCVIGGFFTFLPNYCNQSAVQRMCSMKNIRHAKIALLINIPLNLVFITVLMFMGLVMYSYFAMLQCDPIEAGYINNPNQLMPYFVLLILKNTPALAGIFIAALFSGALSSLSSGINSLATNTLQDLFVNYIGKMSQVKVTLIAKFLVFGYGALAIVIAYAMKEMSGPVSQIANTAFGACGGPYLGMYFLGAIFPQANKIGALTGGIVGIIFNVWLAVSSVLHKHPPPRSPLIGTSGCGVNSTFAPNVTVNPYSMLEYTIPKSTLDYTDVFLDGSIDSSSEIDAQFTDVVSVEEGHMHLYDISYLWIGLTGFLISLVTGMMVSLCSGKDKNRHTDPKYIFPFLRGFWAFQYTSNRSSYVVSDKRRNSKRMSTNDLDALEEMTPIRALEYNTLERD